MRSASTYTSRHLERLFALGTFGGMTDVQLLDEFASGDNESAGMAFEVIVGRHGPMVLRVCRGVLHDTHAAEDAFQATFLVLAQGAATSIRGASEQLAPWGCGEDCPESQGDFRPSPKL